MQRCHGASAWHLCAALLIQTDFNRNAARERVEYRRECWPKLAKLFELLVGHVRFDPKLDLNVLVTLANIRVETKEAVQINLAFGSRLYFLKPNSVCRSMIDQRSGHTSHERMHQVFDGIRC